MNLSDVITKIKHYKKIAITFHTSPDGDALGSALALLIGLRKLNKEVYIVSKEIIPQSFMFLPLAHEISGEINEPLVDTDCLIVLDCGDFKRINANLSMQNRKFALINVDHHVSNDLYGDLNYVDTTASAVAEIVYEVLKLLKVKIDSEISTCLYTSLLTDTGSFRHSSTTAATHRIAGELINTGIDFSNIHRIIFENRKFEQVKFCGEIINNMTLELHGTVCVMYIPKSLIEKYNLEPSDTSDAVTLGSSIDTVQVTIVIREAENGVKVSLRSKSTVDVRKIAEEFNGGGHIRAAGFFTETNFHDAKAKLIEILEKELIK